jgi:hypothetical protein
VLKCLPIQQQGLVLIFNATQWRVFAVMETVRQTRCLAQEIWEMYPWTHSASEVRICCHVVYDNIHSLHLWKRHPCTSPVWRQLMDWCRQVTTWYDLRGLLCGCSSIACLLIQSKCIELQPSVNILIWVMWLFNYPVVPIFSRVLYPLVALYIVITRRFLLSV